QQKPDDPNSGPQKIDQQNEVTADAVYLDIESTLPSDGEPQGLRDIKPLRPRPTTIPLWPLYLLIAVLLLGGLFSWLYRRFYKTKEIEAPPPVPAHKTANEGLTHLLSRWPVEDRAQRRLYFSASEILRIYVEARFELNASDLTTDEIVARLSNLKDLQQSEQTRLRQFLRASDRVKFAGDAPIENDFSALVEEARRFVGATRPTLSEQQQDGADQETTEATS
ncbi:hypothetical protein KAI87_06400, partial [Myxococcota bacterium]|nr:hypothetical protein [Myxococcota bacterium]